jgi:hypothetical protein
MRLIRWNVNAVCLNHSVNSCTWVVNDIRRSLMPKIVKLFRNFKIVVGWDVVAAALPACRVMHDWKDI